MSGPLPVVVSALAAAQIHAAAEWWRAIVEVRLRRGYSILNATDGYAAAALRKDGGVSMTIAASGKNPQADAKGGDYLRLTANGWEAGIRSFSRHA